MDVVKGNDSITAGINKIKALLKQGRLHIHANCINLIWEFENYSYAEKRNNSNEPETPIKENDHAMDAIRYVILMNDLTPTVKHIDHRRHYQTRQTNIKARR
jgi:phage terminase large subunit